MYHVRNISIQSKYSCDKNETTAGIDKRLLTIPSQNQNKVEVV